MKVDLYNCSVFVCIDSAQFSNVSSVRLETDASKKLQVEAAAYST